MSFPDFNVFQQDATPTAVKVGDLWINSAGVIKQCRFIPPSGGANAIWKIMFSGDAAMSGDATFTDPGAVFSLRQDLLKSVQITLTNGQIKALRATPITVVAAQGAGTVIVPFDACAYLKYGGTNAFTAAANDNLSLKLKDGSGPILFSGGVQAMIQATNSALSVFVPGLAVGSTSNISKANADNVPLVIHNQTAGEIAGNAAGDNTIVLYVQYAVITPGW